MPVPTLGSLPLTLGVSLSALLLAGSTAAAAAIPQLPLEPMPSDLSREKEKEKEGEEPGEEPGEDPAKPEGAGEGAGEFEEFPMEFDEASFLEDFDVEELEEDVENRRPRHRLIYRNLFGARYNPLGLINDLSLGYRYQLVNHDDALYSESFLAGFLHVGMTPAYVAVGPRIDIQPLAILNFAASYDYMGFFSTFGQLLSYPSAQGDWAQSTLDRLDDEGQAYGTTGQLVTLSTTLQAKVKNIAFRNNVRFFYSVFNLRDNHKTYYFQTLDMLMPNNGWAVSNDLDLLYLFDFGLSLGVRYTLTHAFYREDDFLEGEEFNPKISGPTHRIGPSLMYTFYSRPDRRFDQPTVILMPQWWVKHPYRSGQDVSAAIPALVLAFRFQGDLYPHPKTWNPKSERRRRRNR